MAEKVRFRCSDGVVIEADKEVMTFASKVVRDMTDVANTDIGTIPLQNISSLDLKRVIASCEKWHDLFFNGRGLGPLEDYLFGWGSHIHLGDNGNLLFGRTVRAMCEDILESQKAGMIHIESALKSQPEADELAERIREGVKFDVGTFITRFTNQSCAKFDWEAIKSMHKVAKYLDIKFLLVLTEALIREAPSRKFMEAVSPWVDYKDVEAYRSHHVEAYRSHHVEACRNLEVAVA